MNLRPQASAEMMDSETVETVCRPDADLADALPDEDIARASVQLLKGMADGTRLKLLCMLRGREMLGNALLHGGEARE